MASSNPLSTRLEELRSRNPQSPPSDNVHSGYTTPTRYSGSFLNSHSLPLSNENRAFLQRRFTADSNNTPPVLNPIGYQPASAMDSMEMNANTSFKAQALERKRKELETRREQRRQLDAHLEALDRQQGQEEEEYRQQVTEMISGDAQGLNFSPGHQSEPTTPPEYRDQYRDQVYASMRSGRRNRYSYNSLVSPPTANNRLSRSGSQLTSPPSEPAHMLQNGSDEDKLPSKSVPGSRRGSTDKFASYMPETSAIGRRSYIRPNRYSMPVTSTMPPKRESVPDLTSAMGMASISTTSFLFDDEEKSHGQKESTTSPDVKTYLQMNTTDDKFPILIRNNHQPGVLSASSAALDLALSNSTGNEAEANDWPSISHHRFSQQSMPPSVFDTHDSSQHGLGSPTGSQQLESIIDSPTAQRTVNRHSMESSLASLGSKNLFNSNVTNGSAVPRPNLSNIQSSFSTNDIPTLKSNPAASAVPAQATHAEKHFHNHNASMGRIPPNGVNNRISRDLATNSASSATSVPSMEARRDEPLNGLKQLHSDLQANATPFGPTTSAGSPAEPISGAITPPNMQPFANPAFYGGYGMQMMNMGMAPMQMGGMSPFANQMSMLQGQNQFGPYSPYNQMGRMQDSQARVIQQRRTQNNDDNTRFNNTKIESYKGEIYALCKDQHGCRYLQKQLETRNAESVQLIFMETHQHVVELMTDPFGNYLCQKLLEHCDDGQRTVLVNSAAPQMVNIALNQHGTRALQKMIEHLSTPEQIQTVIDALKDHVVQLIQDLNGNHVIQKCLNRLSPDDFQFIFDSVGRSCVAVGSHRHGCCVLQRCIDHATGPQKADLIAQITQNAFSLVQDPYGNYVLQYIIDLNDPTFTNPMCYSFQTSVPGLSKHKFSSNVIEKCIRHAEPSVANLMIEEMLNANELEKMLRDSYANYVVQTALDSAEPEMRARLVEAIKPILPSIRHTTHGRRIQGKITSDGAGSVGPSPDRVQPAMSRPMMNGHGGMHGRGGFNGPSHRHAMYAGQAPPFYNPHGMAPQPAFTPNGTARTAFVPNGVAANGPMPHGPAANGTMPNGAVANGPMPRAGRANGGFPGGFNMPRGAAFSAQGPSAFGHGNGAFGNGNAAYGLDTF